MKRKFCINFLLGSIMLIILFFNLAVISVNMTFESANKSNYISYLIISIIDVIYFAIIVVINKKLIKEYNVKIKNVLLNVLLPLLLPTILAVLILFIYGSFYNNYFML